MTYQFSHFSKRITVSLKDKSVAVHINDKGNETVRNLACTSIQKIHLSTSGSNICKCKIYFAEDSYTLSLSSIDMHLKLVRASQEQLAAYRLFVQALHEKILPYDGLRGNVKFVCGSSVKMWFYIAIISAFFLFTVPMAISIGRYEILLLPLGSIVILLSVMRKSGFTRNYNPQDSGAIAAFLPDTGK